ncbi:MAG: antibiotic biosynthesis monooxygenase [Gammaproteobacteria bacterium]|jgi:quinol monooxygenase YgiN|nr:antibiotic biosynthesis monooxygenase [Gammaproteobacteria bacterium]
MIVVNGIVRTTQEDIVALQNAIATMEQASREEPGCLDYTFSVELNDSAVVRITEKWETLEALQKHFEMPHMAAFQAAMGERPPLSMDVAFYEVQEIQPF